MPSPVKDALKLQRHCGPLIHSDVSISNDEDNRHGLGPWSVQVLGEAPEGRMALNLHSDPVGGTNILPMAPMEKQVAGDGPGTCPYPLSVVRCQAVTRALAMPAARCCPPHISQEEERGTNRCHVPPAVPAAHPGDLPAKAQVRPAGENWDGEAFSCPRTGWRGNRKAFSSPSG